MPTTPDDKRAAAEQKDRDTKAAEAMANGLAELSDKTLRLFMVIDRDGIDWLPESLATSQRQAAQQFFDLNWEDIRQREIDAMGGRYVVVPVEVRVAGGPWNIIAEPTP